MSGELQTHIRDAIVYLVALILSICVHEFGHAFVADKLGDPLPRAQGRVTLNPIAHIDPVGTLLLPILAFFMSMSSPGIGSRIIGWGKPVQVSLSARSMTRKISIRTADILISAAGPMMNILFAFVLTGIAFGLLKLGLASMSEDSASLRFAVVLQTVVYMNFVLAFFNLIPLPPLDGGHIAVNLSGGRNGDVGKFLERYGSFVLFGLIMLPVGPGGASPLAYAMIPARWAAHKWLGLCLGDWAL